MMVFYNFFNFSAIFLKFFILSRVETHRNDFFFLPLSRPFPTYFGLKWSYDGVSKFFEFFCYFLFRFGMKPIGTIIFISPFIGLTQPIYGLKWSYDGVWKFFEFFCFFLEFSIPGRVEAHRNDYFYFLSFSAFLILFWLEMKLWWCFQIFWIFLLFFWNFLFRIG